MIPKTISERVYNTDQSWYYEQVVKVKNFTTHTLRVTIRRNAYDNQSYAHVHRWNGTEWKLVVSAPITECECKKISYTDNNVTKKVFENDAFRLVNEAIAIIID